MRWDNPGVRLIDFRTTRAQPVDRYESRAAAFAPIALAQGDGHLGCMYLGPGGGLGRHQAARAQLFCVLSGEGMVSGADGVTRSIGAGQAALWERGEEHESSTDRGMVVMILEAATSIDAVTD